MTHIQGRTAADCPRASVPLDLPAALRIASIEQATLDAAHIAQMLDVLLGLDCWGGMENPVPAGLHVVRDLAEILEWNLRRLDGQRSGVAA